MLPDPVRGNEAGGSTFKGPRKNEITDYSKQHRAVGSAQIARQDTSMASLILQHIDAGEDCGFLLFELRNTIRGIEWSPSIGPKRNASGALVTAVLKAMHLFDFGIDGGNPTVQRLDLLAVPLRIFRTDRLSGSVAIFDG